MKELISELLSHVKSPTPFFWGMLLLVIGTALLSGCVSNREPSLAIIGDIPFDGSLQIRQ